MPRSFNEEANVWLELSKKARVFYYTLLAKCKEFETKYHASGRGNTGAYVPFAKNHFTVAPDLRQHLLL